MTSAWDRFQVLFPSLRLLREGSSPSGLFAPREIVSRNVGAFELPQVIREQIREPHRATWEANGLTDETKIGIRDLSIQGGSPAPEIEPTSSSPSILIDAHVYRYFDFMATHRLLSKGSEKERSLLNGFAVKPQPNRPIKGFPNALGAGLSLFCEQGRLLVVAVRTKEIALGGQRQGGKFFNAVGENVELTDFTLGVGEKQTESVPLVAARRGLYEEMGLTTNNVDGAIALHSFAWASDILDYKFFGYVTTPLPSAEVHKRWKNAPHGREHQEITFVDVATSEDCFNLWRDILSSPERWSPEAVFCTARTLLLLQKLRTKDFASTLG